jgi:AraC-like DNA-binding protein
LSTEFRAVRFSTEDVTERDRPEFLREVYGRMIIKHDFEPLLDDPIRCDGELQALPSLGLASARSSSVRALRRPSQVDSDDDIVFNMTLAGGRNLQRAGRDISAVPGEAILSRSVTGCCDISPGSRWLSIRVPRAALARTVKDIDAAQWRPIPATTPHLSLLRGYVELALSTRALASLETSHLVVNHIHDLLAVVLGATRDALAIAAGRGVGAARLSAIKADIVANVGSRELGLEAVARQHGISAVYLRQLFATEGTSFSDFLLESRLTHAHRLLTDPCRRQHKIGQIAFESGFGDLSYFNRAFRRRFAATPGEVREAASSPYHIIAEPHRVPEI